MTTTTLASAIVFDPLLPLPLVVGIGVILAAATVAAYFHIGTRVSRAQNSALTIFRLLGLAAVLLLLLQPSRMEEIPPPDIRRVTVVAVDASKSMAQNDTDAGTRAESARALLVDAGLLNANGAPASRAVQLFQFGADATPAPTFPEPTATTTRFHKSISTILSSLRSNESARAILLFSDGHDFELINPAKTGFLARQRHVPIFAIALGKQGKVRDVAVRITGYQPFTYVKQKARITAALRFTGVELETVRVELLREGKLVQTKNVSTGDASEAPVEFEVVEEKTGQFEYEVRAVPVRGETERENNSALTYLNVVDQQIQVLFLEGAPYWDTTFLQRSLLRNDKMNVSSVVQFTRDKARTIRKDPKPGEMKLPASTQDWARYDVVILGRSLERLLSAEQVRAMEAYVRDGGGTVIFARGPAFDGPLARNEIEPVIWSEQATPGVRLQVAREGQSTPPFRALASAAGGLDAQPELIAGHAAVEKKSLSATLATVQADGEPMPGFVHRRFGNGQVLAVGVDGLWRWAFNAKVDGANTIFDRFWDNLILWLLASRDFLPTDKFALRASSANIPLGEKIWFRAIQREPQPGVREIPLIVRRDEEVVARLTLAPPDPKEPDRLAAEFEPPARGKYEATAQFPDGTRQTVRFIAFDDNLEETEVSTDNGYLRKLSEASGGRLLTAAEMPKLLAELRDDKTRTTPMTRLVSAWDRSWVLWLIAGLFAADWYLRRRWGLC